MVITRLRDDFTPVEPAALAAIAAYAIDVDLITISGPSRAFADGLARRSI